jgi:hypothetical protein
MAGCAHQDHRLDTPKLDFTWSSALPGSFPERSEEQAGPGSNGVRNGKQLHRLDILFF